MENLLAQKIYSAYINSDEKELDYLWKEEAPKSLIKFYPGSYNSDGSNYFLDNLRNNKIWLSSPSIFNDPFDCLINYDIKSEVKNISNNILNTLIGEVNAERLLKTDKGIQILSKME